jgi:hypothetical protein
MAITSTTLGRSAGVAAIAAGLIFIGVQINHPPLNATTIATLNVEIRDCLKVLMAALAVAGITGMYLRQIKQSGVLGLIGYVLLSAGYLAILCTSFVGAVILPSIARTVPGYVNDVLTTATGGSPIGHVGLLHTAILIQELTYLAGGLVFGIALYRAHVLARWAAALLAAGGVISAALNVMPDAFYRLLAFPNGIAMIALGYSLWRISRTEAVAVPDPRLTTAGAE